jgi:cytochrome P450
MNGGGQNAASEFPAACDGAAMNDIRGFDLMDSSVHADPYPTYAWLRESAPVYAIEGPSPVFAVSRHEDIDRILHDHETFASDLGMDVPLMSMVMKDPPDHTRLRQAVNRAFTPRAVQHLESRIRAVASDFATALTGPCEFVSAFANPLPVTVICEMLGVPLSRRGRMNRYARDALLASFAATGMGSAELRAEAEQGLQALMQILDEAIDRHIAEPRDNIISTLVRAEAEGSLTRSEMRHLCALLLIAGHETTANLIASGARQLAVDRDLYEALKAEPDLIPGFVEEQVRMTPPLQRIMRRATRSIEIAGIAIPEGAMILLLPGSANRDGDKWDSPDRFDARRNNRGHLGFGTGIHVCPGASLSRMEARIAFEVILSTTASIRLDPERPAVPIVGYGAGSLGWNTLPLIFEEP